MESMVKSISNAEEFQKVLTEWNTLETYLPAVWHLLPGVYELKINLPPFVKIKGSGIGLTTVKLLDTLTLESNNIIEDITLEYSNDGSGNAVSELESFQLCVINCKSYLEQMYQPLDLIFSNQVVLRNCEINLFDLEGCYVFNILSGNLKLENVKLTHQVLDREVVNLHSIHNLFTLNYLCQLEILSSDFNYETKSGNTFLFSGNISQIDIRNSQIVLHSALSLENTYLFYLVSTKLNIHHSKLENRVSEGNLFFWDVENNLDFQNLLSNFQIKNGKMIIQKLGDDKNSWRLVSFLSGFCFQGQKYIFERVEDMEEQYVIDLGYLEVEDIELQLEPEIQLLFLVSVSHSFLLDRNKNSWLQEIPDNYILHIQNVINQNGKQVSQLSQVLEHTVSYDFIQGSLQVDNLQVKDISSLQMSQIFKCDRGYSLLDKEKVGSESIDLTLGDSSITGIYNFASGNNIQSEGHYAMVLGHHNKVSASHSVTLGNHLSNKLDGSIVLGKYNNELEDPNLILVVGNGNEKKRKNAMVIYQNGDMKVQNTLEAVNLTDGVCSIGEGNIQGVQNLEVEGHIFVNNSLEVEGSIRGYSVTSNLIPTRVLETAGEIVTTCQLDLRDFISPTRYNSLITKDNTNSKYVMQIDEEIQGVIYQIEVICLETPNRQDMRFMVSSYQNIVELDSDMIDLVSSYEWKKGKRIVEEEKFKFDWDYEKNPYFLYLAREVDNPHYQDYGEKMMEGKFLIRFRGAKLF